MTEKEKLLKDLALAIEDIIVAQNNRPPDQRIWGVFSGLPKVLDIAQHILKDGSLSYDYKGREECRTFVLNENNEIADLFGSASIEGWLQLQLSTQSLTQKLRDLYSNKERLGRHYKRDSISANPVHRQTFLLLIEALEQLDLERLSALNLRTPKKTKMKTVKSRNKKLKQGVPSAPTQPLSPKSQQLDLLDIVDVERKPLERTTSLPNILNLEKLVSFVRRGSFSNKKEYDTHSYEQIITNLMKLNGSPSNKEKGEIISEKEESQIEKSEANDKILVKSHQRTRSDTSTINFNLGQDQNDSIVTGSWTEIVPASTGWYPKPKANQSLVAFLSESGGDSLKKGRRAQLDRENAHFILSEAMISTFEQMNFERSLKEYEEKKEESDDEIRELKFKLKKRRSELKEKEKKSFPSTAILSDGQTDTTTTDQSASPGYSDTEAETENDKLLDSNDEDFVDFEKQTICEMPEGSAESIALSLLSRVGYGRLPPADKLTWLISREEVDQDLLPLPSSLPIDPEAYDDFQDATELRGTLTWAPPRPQIVLTVQDKPKKRSIALGNQKWMCAGCGMKVEQKYSKSFRWCNYLGRYFCTGCHENKTAVIPARIIYFWDFKKHPVSNFSLDILNSMLKEPVFNIHDLNPALLKKVEKLKHVALARTQLSKLARYVSTCRLAQELNFNLESSLVTDNEMYSLDDFGKTRSGTLGPLLSDIISQGLAHVRQCELCQARAYICEGCHSNTFLFPFQVGVFECSECYACYHKTCYKDKVGCVKCKRKHLRLQLEPAVC
eukprot:GFUD01034474.1.p1 GENE.GFUD01034474.1~~GFUD01034474.1.p1  ORF type:complete len:784 (-),score=183.43 GFUD01034474.1:2335-4686(-)